MTVLRLKEEPQNGVKRMVTTHPAEATESEIEPLVLLPSAMTRPSRLVSFPWYDGPQTAVAFDKFWMTLRRLLQEAGVVDLPTALVRDVPPRQQWLQPQLLLSQCCGLDLFTTEGADLRCLAAPVFRNLHCSRGDYFSYVVQHESSAGGNRLAVNALSSRSGCTALLAWLMEHDRVAGDIVVTGSHHASLEQLRGGHADLAAIDAHSWAQLKNDDMKILGRTATAPAPPFVIGPDAPADFVFSALEAAVAQDGKMIGLAGICRRERSDYHCLFEEAVATARPEVMRRLNPRLSRL